MFYNIFLKRCCKKPSFCYSIKVEIVEQELIRELVYGNVFYHVSVEAVCNFRKGHFRVEIIRSSLIAQEIM